MTTNNISLATALAHRDAWIAADLALATAKSYTIGNRQLTRADAQEVRNNIAYWQRVVESIEATNAGADSGGPAIATFT